MAARIERQMVRLIETDHLFNANRPCVQGKQTICLQPVSYTHLDVYKRQGMGFIIFKGLDKIHGLRVSKRVEEEGLDIYEHGESAYGA